MDTLLVIIHGGAIRPSHDRCRSEETASQRQSFISRPASRDYEGGDRVFRSMTCINVAAGEHFGGMAVYTPPQVVTSDDR